MKKIVYRLLVLGISLFLSACGGGDTKESNTSSKTKIIVINCDGTGLGINDCASGGSNHTCIKSGDTLVSENNNTNLEVINNNDGSKKVCVSNASVGKAYLLR